MTNDRELLEAAAKAAGIIAQWHNGCGEALALVGVTNTPRLYWNPLTDDGDEARLESALMLHVEWNPAMRTVSVGTSEVVFVEHWGADRQAARRRAGVRAAAAIGAQR